MRRKTSSSCGRKAGSVAWRVVVMLVKWFVWKVRGRSGIQLFGGEGGLAGRGGVWWKWRSMLSKRMFFLFISWH